MLCKAKNKLISAILNPLFADILVCRTSCLKPLSRMRKLSHVCNRLLKRISGSGFLSRAAWKNRPGKKLRARVADTFFRSIIT